MRAGQLRHKLTLQSPGTVAADGKQLRDDWTTPTTVATLQGSIRRLSGQERIAANTGIETRQSTHEIRTRYISGVTTRMRFAFGAKFYYIQEKDNLEERNRELVLICREAVA